MGQKIDYRLAIDELIPNLHKFSYLKGCEGRVYFIDDKYVLKVYHDYSDNPELFDLFCRENQAFAEKGYAVPKIYAWKMTEDRDGKHVFYVLKERVPGRSLDPVIISDLYGKFEDSCTKHEFNMARRSQRMNPELSERIMIEYAKDFVLVNENLLGVSERELERYFMSCFEMCTQAEYTFTDIKPSNVITSGESLIAIDNGFRLYGKESPLSKKEGRQRVIAEVFDLFSANSKLNFEIERLQVKPASVLELQSKNQELCFELMQRLVRVSTSVLGSNKLGWRKFRESYLQAEYAVGQDRAKTIMSQLEQE